MSIVVPVLHELWYEAVAKIMRELTGSDETVTPDALLLAVSIAEAPKRAEWIDGLPPEPGSYWYARAYGANGIWAVYHGQMYPNGEHGLDDGSRVGEAGFRVKHQPAPPLPEEPSS